ncbi:Carbohydrate-binding domain, family 9-like, subgroup [Mycena kentingensis (nom. inval.)]|nr:Carbohydrate-binding domain, family 9-like, subgroup [Mycena kentingensis (nom. inval.)]
MLRSLLLATFAVVPAFAAVPSLKVPACPAKGSISYNLSVPDKAPFPRTDVDVCYDASAIHITFTAHNETNFFVNKTFGTNDPIYMYTAMETFIALGTGDPQTYLEFEIAPNNVRADGAQFDTLYLQDPIGDGLTGVTKTDKPAKLWTSAVRIPLGLFNVDNGKAKGTQWRMNFFRIITSPKSFPDQFYGAWNPPSEANFHMTPFFGNVQFV